MPPHYTSRILPLLAVAYQKKKHDVSGGNSSSTPLWWAGWILTNEVSVAVETPQGEVPQRGRVQIDNLCAVLLLQDCTSQRPEGEGRETITTSFFRGHASHRHVYCSSSHIFHPFPSFTESATGFDRIPRYTLLAGLADRWMQHAITSRNRHTLTSLSTCHFSQPLLFIYSQAHTHTLSVTHAHTHTDVPLPSSAYLLFLACVFTNAFTRSALRPSFHWCYSKEIKHPYRIVTDTLLLPLCRWTM